MIKNWLLFFAFALASFVAASGSVVIGFFASKGERAEYTSSVAPLPPPGSSTTLSFATAQNWRRYQLSLVTPLSATGSSTPQSFMPCDLQVNFKHFDQKENISKRFRMSLNKTNPSNSEAFYSTEVFEFPPGWYDVEISNLGCDDNFKFVSGALQMERMSPVMLSATTIPSLAFLAFSLLGLLAALIGSLGWFLNRRAMSDLI